jgi:Carboxypeptidase regulatory-like domain/TonB dependent receptor
VTQLKNFLNLNRVFVLVVVMMVSVGSGLAQSTATLSGAVTDPSGAVVPNARVTVQSLATGIERVVVTDEAGLYAVPSLEPGEYQVQVAAAGFSLYIVKKVTLSVDQKVAVNMALAVSSAGETVQVEATSTQIETQTMTQGQVIDRNTVQNIPLNGRHFLDLTVLTPGGVVAPTAGSLTAASRGLGANSFITAGNREDTVNFQINGVNLNDMVQNQITFQPSIDTTSEFKINNSTFSAEYGRSSGSIVNVSTRSGGNSFHGEAFDYFRNEALDARNYFNRGTPFVTGTAASKAPLKRNNFGGAIGGPIWKEHTFFFFSYEGLRQRQGLLQNSTVFSAAQRATVKALGMPAANALLPLVPVANDPTGTHYIQFTPGPVEINQYTGDVLHHFGPSDQLHGFYAFQSDVRTEPNLQGNTIPGFGDHRSAHRQVLTLNWSHIFNPNFVNEARLGFNRISIAFTPNALLNPANFDLGTGTTGNVGIPQITITDVGGLNFGGPAGFPQGRNDTYGVFSDAATYLKGRHTIKFGGEYRRFINVNFTGDTGTMTYSTFVNFSKDLANAYQVTPTVLSNRLYVNAIGVFAQDNFRLNPHLTLEYGLRFEWNGTPTEGENRLVNFFPATSSLIQTGTQGLGAVYSQNYNVDPRVGFAWDVFGTAKTVVRGGFSLMSDQPSTNVVTPLAGNAPFTSAVNYSSQTVPIPVGTAYSSAAASGLAVSSVDPNFRNGYIQSFNLNVQHQLPAGVVVQAGYYGSLGRHLRARINQNQPNAAGVRPFPGISTSSLIAAGSPSAVNFAEASSVGSSNYNAMWLTATKNLSHGLQFNVTYDLSKSMDLNSLGSQGGNTFADSTNPRLNYGPSDFDTRNHVSGLALYNLPFKGNRFVEGFQLSTIVQYQTGNPLTLTNTSTFTGISGVIRPNLVGPIVTKKIQTAITNVTFIQSPVCLNGLVPPACSFQNTTNSQGNLSRNSIYGPGFASVDLSGEKSTKITEWLTFNLRADAFDILNHPNFAQPSGSTTSSSFGQISATRFAISDGGSSRQLQLSGKFIF